MIIFFYYEETRGKTLEAIDEVFDGQRHTQVETDVYEEFRQKYRWLEPINLTLSFLCILFDIILKLYFIVKVVITTLLNIIIYIVAQILEAREPNSQISDQEFSHAGLQISHTLCFLLAFIEMN